MSGAGLDHMTGLLQMVEQANDAGEFMPLVIMRDGDHQVKEIRQGSQVRQILKNTAARENMVESSSQYCHGRIPCTGQDQGRRHSITG